MNILRCCFSHLSSANESLGAQWRWELAVASWSAMLPRGHATQSGHTEPSVSPLSAPSAPPYLYDARIAYVSPYSLRTGRLDGARRDRPPIQCGRSACGAHSLHTRLRSAPASASYLSSKIHNHAAGPLPLPGPPGAGPAGAGEPRVSRGTREIADRTRGTATVAGVPGAERRAIA